jgi:hypothetical protein
MTNYIKTTRNAALAMFVAALTFGAGSCKKDGVNENLDPADQKSFDLMPSTSGSYWKYGSRDGVDYTRYSRGRDSVMNGKTYSYYERQDAGGNLLPEYFGKNDGYYTMLVDLDGSMTNYLEYVFWKENAALNDQWNNTGEITGPGFGKVAVLIESQEVENGLTMSWGGKTYANVVHVHSDGKVTALNLKVATFDFWFAKGLGVIRQETDVNVAGFYKINHVDSLIEYHLN